MATFANQASNISALKSKFHQLLSSQPSSDSERNDDEKETDGAYHGLISGILMVGHAMLRVRLDRRADIISFLFLFPNAMIPLCSPLLSLLQPNTSLQHKQLALIPFKKN